MKHQAKGGSFVWDIGFVDYRNIKIKVMKAKLGKYNSYRII